MLPGPPSCSPMFHFPDTDTVSINKLLQAIYGTLPALRGAPYVLEIRGPFLDRTASRCRKAFILPLWVLSSFWRLISEVTERISTKLGNIFTWKFGPNSSGIHSTDWGQKCFLGPTLNFDRTYFCNGTWYQQSEINLSIYRVQGLPYMPANLVNFGPETAENGWRVFAHPFKFSHWETRPALPHGRYITDNRQTLAHVM